MRLDKLEQKHLSPPGIHFCKYPFPPASYSPPLLSVSQFSDNYYRADLIRALTNSLTPAISISNEVRTVDNLNSDVRLILEEITRYLNMEKLLPSFRNTITVRLIVSIHCREILLKRTSLLEKNISPVTFPSAVVSELFASFRKTVIFQVTPHSSSPTLSTDTLWTFVSPRWRL